MANDVLKRDDNRVTVSAGVTDDANQYIKMLIVDPATGALKVTVVGASGGTSLADNAAFVPGTTAFTPAGGEVNDSTPSAATEGHAGAFRMSVRRELYTQIRDAAGNERGVNVSAANALKVDGSGVTQPVSGTVTTTPPANASTNVAQIAGTTADTNSGVKSAGTLRVVLATDQPALTNKLLVTPDSVALPANQSVNVSQVAGTTTDTNSGVKSAGTLRVVLATDQPQLTAKLLVTPDSVALPANQSVNVSQINAVTPLMGNGATGTGSQRVTIASDNTVLPAVGAGATAAAVPANASYSGSIAKTALPAAATDANLVGQMSDKFGRQVTIPITIRDLTGTQTTTLSASTAETTIVTAIASTFNDLVMLVVSNTSASTNTRIDFRDVSAGTVLFSLQSPGNSTIGFAPPVPIPQTTVNTAWTAQCATSTTDVRIYAVYAKNK